MAGKSRSRDYFYRSFNLWHLIGYCLVCRLWLSFNLWHLIVYCLVLLVAVVPRNQPQNLTVNRQKRINIIVDRQKTVVISRQMVLRSFKSPYFSCSSRTTGLGCSKSVKLTHGYHQV